MAYLHENIEEFTNAVNLASEQYAILPAGEMRHGWRPCMIPRMKRTSYWNFVMNMWCNS